MPGFHLHLVTDATAAPDLPGALEQALAGGVDWVQVREKSLPAGALYEMAVRVGALCRNARVGLLVNDRVDVALAAGADGAHLAARSLPAAAARPLLSDGRLLGVSVHSLAEARAAEAAGVDYVTFGSVYPTRSHPGQAAAGLAELAAVVQGVSIPVLAIGGITAENAGQVLATGCAGVALISAVLSAPSPREAAAALRYVLDRSPALPRVPFPLRRQFDLHKGGVR